MECLHRGKLHFLPGQPVPVVPKRNSDHLNRSSIYLGCLSETNSSPSCNYRQMKTNRMVLVRAFPLGARGGSCCAGCVQHHREAAPHRAGPGPGSAGRLGPERRAWAAPVRCPRERCGKRSSRAAPEGLGFKGSKGFFACLL